MPDTPLKGLLTDRLMALEAKRADYVRRHAGEVQAVNDQIAATQQLLARLDRIPVEEGITELRKAGISVRME